MRTFPSSPPAGVTLAERVWELEARIQQWEFEFFRDKGRKPAFIERREDAEHMRMEVRGRHATAAAARLSLPLPLPPPSLPAVHPQPASPARDPRCARRAGGSCPRSSPDLAQISP